MIGTLLNVAGILAGSVVGLARRKGFSTAAESFSRVALGAFTVFCGLRLTWVSLEGTWRHVLKQLVVAVLALMLGRITGRLFRLQKMSNRLGRYARDRIEAAQPGRRDLLSDGFKACSVLFVAAPLGILGGVQDGLSGYFYPLAVKGVMDGLAAAGFALIFGWGAMLAALPVLAFQGTVTLFCLRMAGPFLEAHSVAHDLTRSVNAAGGLLVFSVALVMLQLKKVELADYLPSLVWAPLVTWLWR
jgi:uncharacterized membrane protein YqgA involved in biofilm formation